MRVCEKIDRRELLAALNICGRVTPRRAPSEVLTFVRLERDKIEATDGELRVIVPHPYQGEPMLLPFHKLNELTRVAAGENLALECDGNVAIIKSRAGKWSLPTADPADWPALHSTTRSPVARIPADQLARGLSAVIDAADPQAGQVALGGVHLDVTDGLVSLVATDGRRLFKSEINIDQAVDDSQMLLTARAATLIGVLAGQLGDEGNVQLERSGSDIFAEIGTGGAQVIARQVAGEFPKWRKVIPSKGRATPTTVRADQLNDAIKQAAICTSEASRAIELTLGKTITCKANSSESGASTVKLEPIEAGKEVSIRVNPQFCTEWLRRVDPSEPINVEAVDASSALVFRSEDSTGVVMPMEGTA